MNASSPPPVQAAASSSRVIVVTGAFGNLGRAMVDQLAAAGHRVAALDKAAASPASDHAGPNLLSISDVDLTDSVATTRAFETVASEFGGIDGLVNVAGGFRWQTLEEGSVDAWDWLYAINLKTAVVACKCALPFLRARGQGRIVNIGAAAATRATAGMGAYAAAKAGVARLTESLADELKDHRITVNAILPAIVDTPENRGDMPGADHSRWVSAESISDVARFLLSDAAFAVTGALIPVTHRC